jgi:hypothetical protein
MGDPAKKYTTIDVDIDTPPASEPAAEATAPAPSDPEVDYFANPEALRLSQSFIETAGVKKLLTTVPVRKPNPQDFNRVNPDPQYRLNGVALIKLRDDRDEIFVLTPPIARELTGEFAMATIFTAVNRQEVTFLWPVMLPDPQGRPNEWRRSAAEAAEKAMGSWVRVKANMSLGAYEIFQAQSSMSDPVWPEQSFQELLRIGFRDRLVTSLEHPIVKRLRGLA